MLFAIYFKFSYKIFSNMCNYMYVNHMYAMCNDTFESGNPWLRSQVEGKLKSSTLTMQGNKPVLNQYTVQRENLAWNLSWPGSLQPANFCQQLVSKYMVSLITIFDRVLLHRPAPMHVVQSRMARIFLALGVTAAITHSAKRSLATQDCT